MKIWRCEILLFFFFFNFKLYWARFIVGVLGRSRASVRLLLSSSLPLSCALEHSFLGAGMDANESFGSTNAQLTAGCYISLLRMTFRIHGRDECWSPEYLEFESSVMIFVAMGERAGIMHIENLLFFIARLPILQLLHLFMAFPVSI